MCTFANLVRFSGFRPCIPPLQRHLRSRPNTLWLRPTSWRNSDRLINALDRRRDRQRSAYDNLKKPPAH